MLGVHLEHGLLPQTLPGIIAQQRALVWTAANAQIYGAMDDVKSRVAVPWKSEEVEKMSAGR